MKKEKNDSMEKIVSLCKRRGFIYPSSEIYGGLANAWDFGPMGVELKNNIKSLWWKIFIQEREDMVGLESSIIMNPKVWEASGHVGEFADMMIDCKNCKNRFRADHLVEEAAGIDIEGESPKEAAKVIKNNKIKCPVCGKTDWTEVRDFNLLFKTHIGSVENEKSVAYLRGETAQGMFVDFKQVLNTSRQKIPFGIGQIGKAFRNEVTPGNFIFRTREFEIAELEYFINPKSDWQKIFDAWVDVMKRFGKEIGLKDENIHLHDIPDEKRAHYSKKTVDIEYDFPFGQKELWGLAYRTDYDVKRHQEYSGKDLSYTDPTTNEKYIPHVIEPSLGVERTFLAVLSAAYTEERQGDETRVVMKLPKKLAPIKVAVFPLLKNKPELVKEAQKLFDILKESYMCEFDDNGNIGKRYRRQDEIGTPYCVTIDFDTLSDETVTVRDRDTMKQERVKTADLKAFLSNNL